MVDVIVLNAKFLVNVRSTLALHRYSKRRKRCKDKLHQIINKKLERLKMWLEKTAPAKLLTARQL